MGCLSRVVGLAVLAGAGVWAYARYADRLPTPVRHAAGVVGAAAESLANNAKRNSAFAADEFNKLRPPLTAADSAAADSARRARGADSASNGPKRPSKPIAWATVSSTADVSALAQLNARNGPAYVTVGAGDLASLLAVPLRSQLPRSTTDVQIALVDRQLLVRGVLDVAEIAGDGTLGKLLGIAMSGRDTMQFGGTVEPWRDGFAQFRVEALRVKGFDVPSRAIPAIMRVMRRSNTDSTLAANAFAIRLPRSVADLRIANGRMTLYKTGSDAADRRTPK
jgi:hypothetical protein